MGRVARQTVDLSAFPDLVVIYLGMHSTAGLASSGYLDWVRRSRIP